MTSRALDHNEGEPRPTGTGLRGALAHLTLRLRLCPLCGWSLADHHYDHTMSAEMGGDQYVCPPPSKDPRHRPITGTPDGT